MIPRSLRFPMRTRLLSFRARANKFYSPHLTLLYQPFKLTQLAVIVPKKVNKRATVRNRLKRLLKRELLEFGSLGRLVVLVKPTHLDKKQLTAISQELHSLLQTLSKHQLADSRQQIMDNK